MSDNGYVRAYRRAWHHPIFRDLLDGAVWNYLYQNAAWQDCRVVVNGTRVELKRGQIFITYRSLADGFGCNEKRIRRLTDGLVNAAMIAALPTHRGVLVTVCNYETYQAEIEAAAAAPPQPPPQRRRTGGRTYNKEERKNETNTPPIPPLPDWVPAQAWQAFVRMRQAIKEPLTPEAEVLLVAKLDKLRRGGHDPTEVLNESTTKNWKGLFPLKEDHHAAHRPNNHQPTKSKFQLAVEATERARALRESRSPGPA